MPLLLQLFYAMHTNLLKYLYAVKQTAWFMFCSTEQQTHDDDDDDYDDFPWLNKQINSAIKTTTATINSNSFK